jgi:hypothetical protein
MKWRVESDAGVGATVEAERWACVDIDGQTGVGFYKDADSDKLAAWFSGPRMLECIESEAAASGRAPWKANGSGKGRPAFDPNAPIARDGDREYTPDEVKALLLEKIGDTPRKRVAGEMEVNASHLGQALNGQIRASAKMIKWAGLEPIDRRAGPRE